MEKPEPLKTSPTPPEPWRSAILPHLGQAILRLLEIVGKNRSKTCPWGHLYSYVGIGYELSSVEERGQCNVEGNIPRCTLASRLDSIHDRIRKPAGCR